MFSNRSSSGKTKVGVDNDYFVWNHDSLVKMTFAGATKPMCTARPGWQTISPQNMNYKKRMFGVHVNLVDVLEIDPDKG